MVEKNINWDGFLSDIEGIEVIDKPNSVRLKSRDYFWYSPILNAQLKKCWAHLVVLPRDEAEVMRVASACAKWKVPVTLRGGGTGNYGQAVPLVGGIILETTKLDNVLEVGSGFVRVQAGMMISDLDDAFMRRGKSC